MDTRPTRGLRGKTQAEKRRIARLSRSERVIEDPQDREAVAQFCVFMIWFWDKQEDRNKHRWLDWLVIILSVVAAAVLFASGVPLLWLAPVFAVLAAFLLTTRTLSRRWRRQLQRTAEINGWL